MASQTYGFVGVGIMGEGMIKQLLGANFKVVVWNRSSDKYALVPGAEVAASPAEVISKADVTFACLADPMVAQKVVSMEGGIIDGIKASVGKGYVDCSTVDVACAQAIGKAVVDAGGRFLEAPVSGSKKPAADGNLVFLCAGDEALYKEVTPALEAMGKKSVFLGAVGNGARMKLAVNMTMGGMLCALAEGMALVDACDIQTVDFLEVLNAGAMASPLVAVKGATMVKEDYPTNFPLKHAQKDMRLAVALGDEAGVALPVSAAANEQFKRARAAGHADADFSAVHAVSKKQK